jgi:hypothetical protein
MYKRFLWGEFLLLLVLMTATPSHGEISLLGETMPEGQAYGTVVEVFGANITVLKFELPHPFKVDDRLDLTYMAGMTPIEMGIFEVASFEGDLLNTRPISMLIEPHRDMQIIASLHDPSGKDRRVQKSITRERPPALDVSGAGTEPYARPIEELDGSSGGGGMASGPVVGQVVEVQGEEIFIAFSKDFLPAVRPGQIVELFYVTSAGQELPVGKWKVTSLVEGRVKAVQHEAVGKPRLGFKALIRAED